MALLVQSLIEFINSSFTLITNDSNPVFPNNSETTLDGFKELFVVRIPGAAFLTSYVDPDDNYNEILPDRRIAGEYTCISGNESQTININVTSE